MYRSKLSDQRIKKKQLGFSLIELMVVMAIMAVLMSLTGGLATNNVSKRERLVEIEKVAQIFKRLSYQAYYTGYDIKVRLDKNTLTAHTAGQTKVVEFAQLNFVANDYLVSTKAFVSPDSYRYFAIAPMFKTNEN
jgi:prepilin-type N-terminal cleavage/methylation domain-containing protein